MELTILSTISYCKKICNKFFCCKFWERPKGYFIKDTWWTNHRRTLAGGHIALTTISTNEDMMTLSPIGTFESTKTYGKLVNHICFDKLCKSLLLQPFRL